MKKGKSKSKRKAQVYDWIHKNQKLWYPVKWERESPLRRNLMSYQHMLVYQALVKDGVYSEKTEPTDALRSFRRYIIEHKKEAKKNMSQIQNDEPIFTGFDDKEESLDTKPEASLGEARDHEHDKADFPYLMIDSEKSKKLSAHTGDIKSLVRKTASDIIRIGERLIEVKELLDHGQFGTWLKEEFGWTWRTANNFINVAKKFKLETVSNLNTSARALYLLSSPSTPENVRDEFTERLESGEEVTHQEVKEAIQEHRKDQEHEETVFDEESQESLESKEPVSYEKEREAAESLDHTDEDEPKLKPSPSPVYVTQLDKAIEILNGASLEIEASGDFGIAKRLGFFADETRYIQSKLEDNGVIERIIESRRAS